MNTKAAIELLLGYNDGKGVFLGSAPMLYNEDTRRTGGVVGSLL
jgi:hypothetical protein